MGDDDGNICSVDSFDLDDMQNQLGQRSEEPKDIVELVNKILLTEYCSNHFQKNIKKEYLF